MSRLSRAKKREQQAGPSAAPIEVRVHASDPGASVGGVPVTAAPGQEIQQAVLNHLHRIALAAGHPVYATIQDDRIGYAVPLQINLDGSSALTGEPREVDVAVALAEEPSPAPEAVALAEEPPARDMPTHLLRPPVDPAPTFPLRAVPDLAPGTVAPPTGAFGPPPVMDAQPSAHTDTPPSGPLDAQPVPLGSQPVPLGSKPPPTPKPKPLVQMDPAFDPALDPAPKAPTPPRGFDAVAEAVLGDEPSPAGLLAEPVAGINAAVRDGRTQDAARLAERTVVEAAQNLGPEHPEVLRLRELAAYIAYLAGEPAQAFAISLDLARVHYRAQDSEAAYGNVLSAATAWRAVRDPEHGLRLGHELIALWATLVAEGGPAVEEAERLESARTRMNRLTERVRRQQA
ncbi:tetratricopeptide repeat protein [Streptomyces cinnabarinus]|uniref:Tetratricopeptide repeat protein n=1 Tax=Streptomyces cinnabarinus TaxID=67287 RepID=A0ABY7KK12_9ACTN|nr:tetratricopeptide repeat protein [Streptomyces cinnabarinus]WAZ23437.1 tetratricopeptide repeat protein [Streptomyces cinnabarinus]